MGFVPWPSSLIYEPDGRRKMRERYEREQRSDRTQIVLMATAALILAVIFAAALAKLKGEA